MTFAVDANEARTDIVNWLNKYGPALQFNNPFTAESVVLVGKAVESAAAENKWNRTFPDTEEYLDIKDLADDLTPYMEAIPEFHVNLIASIVGKLGYRHSV